MKPLLVATTVLLLSVSPAAGQPAAAGGPGPTTRPTGRPATQPQGPHTVRLTVRPVAAPRNALQYRLVLVGGEKKPGNAALLYYQAVPAFAQEKKEQKDRILNWLKLPLAELPRKEAADTWQAYEYHLRLVERGARCESCDWALSWREDGVATFMPSLSGHISISRLLTLKAKLEVADGRFDQAISTLQTGLAMNRHLGEGLALVGGMVGILGSNNLLNAVEDIMQSPAGPNLYWALARLPRPPVGAVKNLDMEFFIFDLFPLARRAQAGPLTATQWGDLLVDLHTEISKSGWGRGGPPLRVKVALLAAAMHPRAKEYLIATGRSRQEVEALPVAQAVFLSTLDDYEHWRDESHKWHALPFPLAHSGLAKTEKEFARYRQTAMPFSLPTVLLPSLGMAYFQEARLARRVAMLQCIEAVRMYAAGHEGKLPASLDELTDAPALMDPVTGKPFGYTVAGNKFVLEGPPPAGNPPTDGDRYEVTVVPAGK